MRGKATPAQHLSSSGHGRPKQLVTLSEIRKLELAKQAGGSFYQLSMIGNDLRELREMAEAHGKK